MVDVDGVPFSSATADAASTGPSGSRAVPARRSRADATRLATVATTIDTTITPSDIHVEISGAHSMCSPPLMNGSSLTCIAWKKSLTPMKARMNAMP